MLQRIDDLDRENEKLRDDVAELEDLKEQLEGRLDRTEDLMREANKESKEQKVHASFISVSKCKEDFCVFLHESFAHL